jgi:hypothetical protein
MAPAMTHTTHTTVYFQSATLRSFSIDGRSPQAQASSS